MKDIWKEIKQDKIAKSGIIFRSSFIQNINEDLIP